MSHIFISYSKKNKVYADNLVNYLEKAGFNVWYDGRIDYGTSWERVIFKAIDDCAAFIVVMTPDSYESDWVLRECQYADKRHKPQFPLLLDGEEFPRYGPTQFLDVRGGKLPPDSFLTRLGQVIKPQHLTGKNVAPPEMREQFRLPDPFEWVEIPAGKVTIADRHGEFNVPKFWIAKYPITVAQYELFIKDGGYDHEAYWTAPGWAWRQKENITQPRLRGEKEFAHFFKPDHPIIGVSWYEAIAFCIWFNHRTRGLSPLPDTPFDVALLDNWQKDGQGLILLPTEQQWQRAAQGDKGWAYPWGNEFDEKKCNFNSKSTTPVTQYPKGASPYGVMDMSGNVWEWTLSEYESASTGDINSTDVRVARGGSWWNNYGGNLRVDDRGRGVPDYGSGDYGFRPARSP